MKKSILMSPDHPARVTITLPLLTFLVLSAAVPAVPIERWPVTPSTPELTSPDLSISSPFIMEREKPTGEKFLKTTAVNIPACACDRPGYHYTREIAGGRDNLRITALLVYTQTTSSRL